MPKSLGRVFEEVISGQERRWNEHIYQVGMQFDKLAQMAREREQREYQEQHTKKECVQRPNLPVRRFAK